MAKNYFFWTFCALLPLSFSLRLNKCTPNKYGTELGCPDSFNLIYQIKIIEINYTDVTITCVRETPDWVYDALPDLGVVTIGKLQTKYCPFSNGIREAIKIMGILEIKDLELFYPKHMNISTLKKDYFDELPNIESIKIQGSTLNKLEENVFEELTNLKALELSLNKIEEITPQTLAFVPKLEILNLSGNDLKLTDGIFYNLKNLKLLNLRNCKISGLKPYLFDSLNKLKTLELGINRLQTLPTDILKYLTNLEQINLSFNQLNELPADLFRNNKVLKKILLSNNTNLKLPNYLFESLTNLEIVDLSKCNLKELPENTFENCISLKTIDLEYNSFQTIPEDVFTSLKNLENLNLGFSEILAIPKGAFRNLTNLKKLHLNNNNLAEIDDTIFSSLRNLEALYLSSNTIESIHINAFKNNEKLISLQLDYNKLTLSEFKFDGHLPFEKCVNLENLYLKHNRISDIYESFFMTNLKTLDLVNNSVSLLKLIPAMAKYNYTFEIHLDLNHISKVDFHDFEEYAASIKNLSASFYPEAQIRISLAHNPLQCNCEAYDIVRYFNGNMNRNVLTLLTLKIDDLHCGISNGNVAKIKSETFTCVVSKFTQCPEQCSCYRRPWSKALIVYCSKLNLTFVPPLPIWNDTYNFFNHTVLHLENNLITTVEMDDIHYKNVTQLFLSNNRIKNVIKLPNQIEELHLNNNKLESLSEDFIKFMNSSESLKNVSLNNNPITCSCSISSLMEPTILRKLISPNISCIEDGIEITHLTKDKLCTNSTTVYLTVAIVFVTLLVVVTVLSGLFYKYQQEIKVWLFSRNMMLWWVTEKELDRNKLYDAFISFANDDLQFIENKLLPVLESDPNQYKLCVHYRDWVPGTSVAEHIAKSVANSRRTIVVLTPNFLKSIWGKMEFRTAHETAMKEKCPRLIVILYGNIDNKSNLFEEVKTYLNTKTYIQWGDPNFWNKLKYALPHNDKGTTIVPNKLNNVMIGIENIDSKKECHIIANNNAIDNDLTPNNHILTVSV